MDERGVGLIAALATTGRAQASGRLGITLRSVLLSPTAGFEAAFATARRRSQAGTHPAEGIAPYVLAALGGVAAMLLWLKIGSLVGARRVALVDFRWSYVYVLCGAGALLSLIVQAVWGHAGALVARAAGGRAEPRELRTVWGASAFPQVFALAILLPLDVVIVGPATFTSERLGDPLATGWAAISIAFSVSLAVWSVYIFVRGVETAGRVRWPKASLFAASAAALFVGSAWGLAVALAAIAGAA